MSFSKSFVSVVSFTNFMPIAICRYIPYCKSHSYSLAHEEVVVEGGAVVVVVVVVTVVVVVGGGVVVMVVVVVVMVVVIFSPTLFSSSESGFLSSEQKWSQVVIF